MGRNLLTTTNMADTEKIVCYDRPNGCCDQTLAASLANGGFGGNAMWNNPLK